MQLANFNPLKQGKACGGGAKQAERLYGGLVSVLRIQNDCKDVGNRRSVPALGFTFPLLIAPRNLRFSSENTTTINGK